MKLSKNVLVGSLASAGMILGLVAPATTAFAATTSGVVGEDGKVTASATPNQEVGTLNNSDNLAIADWNGNENSATTTATAKSNVNVDVVSGVLLLKAVPDFGFGSAVAGEKAANLVDNKADGAGVDGNQEGFLTVSDSRSKATGFDVSAQLGDFTSSDLAEGTKAPTGFALTLNPVDMANDGENSTDDPNTALPKTTKAVLNDSDASNAANASNSANVMSLASGKYALGTVKAQFHNPSDATLKVPAGANGTKAVTSYTSTITWTLKAAAVAGA